MENEMISVIVPVYKTEKFLNQCIESIVKQTYKNLEIILIDDGSPDKCSEICDEWEKKDKRIKVIHVENGGAGKARNIGIMNAQGEYFAFVDSDDYLEMHMYEHLYEMLNSEVDIAECEIVITDIDEAEFEYSNKFDLKTYTRLDAMQLHIQNLLFNQTPVNKLYKKKVVEEIFFPEGKMIDDEFWTYKTIGKSHKLAHSKNKLYAYRQQENSVMHSEYSVKRLQAVEAKCERHEYVCKELPELEGESCYNVWFTCIYQGQLALRSINGNECNKVWNYLDEILKNYPIKLSLCNLNFKNKIWLRLAKISLKKTCLLRNFLKIGL